MESLRVAGYRIKYNWKGGGGREKRERQKSWLTEKTLLSGNLSLVFATVVSSVCVDSDEYLANSFFRKSCGVTEVWDTGRNPYGQSVLITLMALMKSAVCTSCPTSLQKRSRSHLEKWLKPISNVPHTLHRSTRGPYPPLPFGLASSGKLPAASTPFSRQQKEDSGDEGEKLWWDTPY